MDIRTATTLRKNIIRTIRETADADDAADKIIGLVGEAEWPVWRPIETAPKDGSAVILGAPAQQFAGKPTEPRSTVGQWTTEEECRVQIGDCGGECRCPEYEYHDPYWMSWDGGFTAENPATHWMPLPTPPSIALVDEAQSKAAGK